MDTYTSRIGGVTLLEHLSALEFHYGIEVDLGLLIAFLLTH